MIARAIKAKVGARHAIRAARTTGAIQMGLKAGSLLWNRQRITLIAGTSLAPSSQDVDTGLTQLNKGFENDSKGEPTLGVGGTTAPADGTLPASRVMVIPMAPLGTWANITHSEPWFSTVTNTVHVTFHNPGLAPVEVNALFWDPHTLVGPGEASTYNAGA